MPYSERLLGEGNFLTRLAHSRRYDKTLALVSDVRGATAIDFGCADALMMRRAYDLGIIRCGYGVDANSPMLELSRKTFAGIDGFAFVAPNALDTVPRHSCDLAICTETLEHVRDAA